MYEEKRKRNPKRGLKRPIFNKRSLKGPIRHPFQWNLCIYSWNQHLQQFHRSSATITVLDISFTLMDCSAQNSQRLWSGTVGPNVFLTATMQFWCSISLFLSHTHTHTLFLSFSLSLSLSQPNKVRDECVCVVPLSLMSNEVFSMACDSSNSRLILAVSSSHRHRTTPLHHTGKTKWWRLKSGSAVVEQIPCNQKLEGLNPSRSCTFHLQFEQKCVSTSDSSKR